ncbi:MAG: hypothetical protein H6942_05065 [Candidatus Accumulibacter sp.]|uniref:hypothetical protein n=1 Tax=Accumulibacter sp. TaxID=2053492 RepID=UPI001A05AE9D|nr:hypothetical protein [Accumulibacter sp.]MBE2259392.1 hypothetical protein [Paracoccaceae bacterium]MCP5247901.1 hypothetical protein [Accumulibacter sp.]
MSFPAAEGVGIFVGIVAWEVLSVGQMHLLKAVLIAAASTLVWYGARHWWTASRRKRH